MQRPCELSCRSQNTFVLTLLLLEAGGNFSDEGRHVLFSATSSLMTFVLMVCISSAAQQLRHVSIPPQHRTTATIPAFFQDTC